jgi:arylsulfatase
VLDGRPVWAYKRSQVPGAGVRIDGAEKLAPGPHTLTVALDYEGKAGEVGAAGSFTLSVDGKAIGAATIDRTVPYIYSVDETLDIGEDDGTPIVEDYADRMPFEYDGRINEVAIDLAPMNLNLRPGPRAEEIE